MALHGNVYFYVVGTLVCPSFRQWLIYFNSGSDASSEKSAGSQSVGNDSISAKNTLLATDTSSHNIKKAMNKITDNMRIDSALFNPDNLWHRPNAGWVETRYKT